MGKKHKRVFDKEFKTEAVRLATAGERTAADVAASLGIDHSLLSKWVAASLAEGADAFRGHGKRTALEEENRRLKLKNEQLDQDRVPKKSEPILCQGPAVRYRHIKQQLGQHPLALMCRALKVSV